MGASVNTVTASLHGELIASSWTGSRYTNTSAVATDFVESCSSSYGYAGFAKDHLYGDNASLTVFAGHAEPHGLYFPEWNHGCSASFPANMRLGQAAGSQAAIGMWLGCEELVDFDTQSGDQWLRQQMGFSNIIAIGNNEPRTVFVMTAPQTIGSLTIPAFSNADAWLATMGGGGRKPIVVTYATSVSACWPYHDGAQLKSNIHTQRRALPPTCGNSKESFYCWEGYR